MINSQERNVGCLLGLAVGDALGTTLEFRAPGSFEPLTDMVGGGPFNLLPGQWTDDTSMALCLGLSLIECGQFDARDQMDRYAKWAREGYMSSTGTCFDIGGTVTEALCAYSFSENPFCGPTSPDRAGNGSIMRLAPIPMFYSKHPALACAYAELSSRTTHGAAACIDACHYLCLLTTRALSGVEKNELFANGERDYCPEITAIANGSFRHKEPPEIAGTGYVVQSLEAALWAFDRTDNFRDGALLAVNLGDDADTTGAVYGQLAGAFYGLEDIPASWRQRITNEAQIVKLADDLSTQGAELDGDIHRQIYTQTVAGIRKSDHQSPFLS